MSLSISNHREREKGVLVYPVYSRRSGGLSVGINLFPDKKICPFNCPYCEVFPFSTNAKYSGDQLKEDLRSAISDAVGKKIVIQDICFSGNGEPSVSPAFPEALEEACSIRDEMAGEAKMVIITCGAGLLDDGIFSLLHKAAISRDLNIWLKLDAGTPEWYARINRTEIPFDRLNEQIREFIACTPVTIQTMLCRVDGKTEPPEEEQAWVSTVTTLAAIAAESNGGSIRKVQLYGKARPAPEDPKTEALPAEYLERRASLLRSSFIKAGTLMKAGAFIPPVEVNP